MLSATFWNSFLPNSFLMCQSATPPPPPPQVPPEVGLRQVRRVRAHPGLPHRQHVGAGVAEHLLPGLALPGCARPGNVDLKECVFPRQVLYVA